MERQECKVLQYWAEKIATRVVHKQLLGKGHRPVTAPSASSIRPRLYLPRAKSRPGLQCLMAIVHPLLSIVYHDEPCSEV